MHTKPVFFRFHEVLKVIFDSRILTVISLLGLSFEIANFSVVLIRNSRKFAISPVDIQKPPRNFQGKVLREDLKPNENKRNCTW